MVALSKNWTEYSSSHVHWTFRNDFATCFKNETITHEYNWVSACYGVFVFHIRHIMCMYTQREWFRGKINVSNKKVFLFVFGKVQTEIFPVLIYFPKVLPFLWFLLSSLLSKIRLLFWKIGRDEKLITLDHSCSTSFITLC